MSFFNKLYFSNSDSIDIRGKAIGYLQRIGSPEALTPLTNILLNDTNVDNRVDAAYVLGELKYPNALGALEKSVLEDKGVTFEGDNGEFWKVSVKTKSQEAILKIKQAEEI